MDRHSVTPQNASRRCFCWDKKLNPNIGGFVFLIKSDKVIAISDCKSFVVISLTDVPSNMRRTTYTEGSKDRQNAIDGCWSNAQRRDFGYVGGASETKYDHCFVAVRASDLIKERPDWFVTGVDLFAQYEKALQSENQLIVGDKEKEFLSNEWSTRLKKLVQEKEAIDKGKQISVVCQGNYPADHEGVAVLDRIELKAH